MGASQASDVQVELGRTAETSSRVPERGSTWGCSHSRMAAAEGPGSSGRGRAREEPKPSSGVWGARAARRGEVLQPLRWPLENLGRLMKGPVPGLAGAGSRARPSGLHTRGAGSGSPLRAHPRQPEPGCWGALMKTCTASSPAGWPGLFPHPDSPSLLDHGQGRRLEVPAGHSRGARGSWQKRCLGSSLTGPSVAGRWQGSCGRSACAPSVSPGTPSPIPRQPLARVWAHARCCPRGPACVPPQRPLQGLRTPTAPLRLRLPPIVLPPGRPGQEGPLAPERTRHVHAGFVA